MNRVLRPTPTEVDNNLSLFHDGSASECRERLDSDGFIDVTMDVEEE